MNAPRRRFSERDVLATLLWQGVTIPCFRCKDPLSLDAGSGHWVYRCEREHLHELELGGEDAPANCRYSGEGCHAAVTNGTPATSAGSSKNRIAKTRGTRADKFIPDKRPLDETRMIDAAARCRVCGEYAADCGHAPLKVRRAIHVR